MSTDKLPDPETTDAAHTAGASEDERWLDRPGSVDRIIWMLILLSAASVAADFGYDKHGHWGFQEWFGFDAAYGFVACVGLVLAAKVLRKLVMRSEDYYE